MKNLTKVQLLSVTVMILLFVFTVATYAKANPTTPPVAKGRPVVTGPKTPVHPLGKTKPSTPPATASAL